MLDNGILIVLPFIVGLLILVFFLIFMRRKKQKDSNSFPNDWRRFEKALVLKDVSGITRYGDLVLWNESISHKNVVYMFTELNKLKKKDVELEKLKQHVFNKKLHIERHSPVY